MPQFELGNALPQVVWLILIFLLLYAGVQAFLPGVGRIVEKRAQTIRDDLSAADQARADARAASEQVETRLAAARLAAAREAADAKAAAERAAAEKLKGVEAGLDARMNEAQARIDASRNSALASLDGVAAEAAQLIIARLTGVEPPADLVTGAVRGASA